MVRPLVEVFRRSDLPDQTARHDDDAVGQRQRLVLIMRDIDRGGADRLVDGADFGAHLQAQLGVEIGQRLVHENDGRADDDGAGDRHALLLTARQLSRQLVALRAQAHEIERGIDAAFGLRLRHALHGQAEADILADRHMGKERVALEHHAEAALFRLQFMDGATIKANFAPRQRQKAGDAVQRRGLAAARWPEQRDELAALHLPDRCRPAPYRCRRRVGGSEVRAGRRRQGERTRGPKPTRKSYGRSSRGISGVMGERLRQLGRSEGAAGSTGRPSEGFERQPFLAPIRSSQMRKAATSLSASSGVSSGLSAIHWSYCGRPNSLIASWLSCGAMDSGTSFTAGPG